LGKEGDLGRLMREGEQRRSWSFYPYLVSSKHDGWWLSSAQRHWSLRGPLAVARVAREDAGGDREDERNDSHIAPGSASTEVYPTSSQQEVVL
jgi:hypothetical protein